MEKTTYKMSDNWDDENFEPTGFNNLGNTASSGKWEGEDDDGDVKESWEDFDEDAEKEKERQTEVKTSTDVTKVVKVKKKKALSEKIAEKEGRGATKPEDDIVDAPQPLTPQELYEEKLLRQRLEEDADLELAKDTFGVKSEAKYGLETMKPTTKAEFDTFKTALLETITKHEKSPLYITFLDELFRDLCLNLEADDVKKLGNMVQILGNEKYKIKMAKGKKKGGKTKASLVVGRANDYVYDADYATNDFEDFM